MPVKNLPVKLMKKRLLTIRKQKWVNQFNPSILRGAPLNPNMGVAAHYQQKLTLLIRRMVEDVKKQVEGLYKEDHAKEFFGQDDSISSQARILTNALKEKYERLFYDEAPGIAEYFASESNKASSKSVHHTIKEFSGGLSIPTANMGGDLVEVFKATVTENVALIKSIPEQYLSGVQQAVMRSIVGGGGKQSVTEYLIKEHAKTYARAKRISLDQTRKAFEGMSRERMKRAGVKKFEWVHTGGSNEPRPLHQHTLNGKIFSYDDPPVIDENTGERGFPGQLINCRCRQAPVIDFGDEEKNAT